MHKVLEVFFLGDLEVAVVGDEDVAAPDPGGLILDEFTKKVGLDEDYLSVSVQNSIIYGIAQNISLKN